MREKSLRISGGKILPIVLVLMTVLALSSVVQAQPTTTTCTSGFSGADIAIRKGSPYDAFITIPGGSVVKHISSISPGSGLCTFGTITDIALPSGTGASWGVALDNSGNLYVATGPSVFSINNILVIPSPYTGTPTIFYSAGTDFRSLAIHGNTLYAADFGAGTILRFDLTAGASSVTTFASIPGVFGLFANGTDDLFVTNNPSGEIEHVTTSGVSTISTGLSFPEGIGGDVSNLYIAAGALVYTVPISGGTPSLYAGSPILFSHGVTVWKGAGYVTDSHGSGEVHKFTLLP